MNSDGTAMRQQLAANPCCWSTAALHQLQRTSASLRSRTRKGSSGGASPARAASAASCSRRCSK